MFNNSQQVVREIVESFEKSLYMGSVGGDGYGLSKEIDHKVDLLLQHGNGLHECNVYVRTQNWH
jgi:hypothetical protein